MFRYIEDFSFSQYSNKLQILAEYEVWFYTVLNQK